MELQAIRQSDNQKSLLNTNIIPPIEILSSTQLSRKNLDELNNNRLRGALIWNYRTKDFKGGARSETWTRTALLPRDFKSLVSTNSTTRAALKFAYILSDYLMIWIYKL